LKGEADADTIKKAMEGETTRTNISAMRRMLAAFGVVVYEYKSVEYEVSYEPDHGHRENSSSRIHVPRQSERLGHEIKEGDSENSAGAEPENQVEPIFQIQCEETAHESREKGCDGDKEDHKAIYTMELTFFEVCGIINGNENSRP
jgi:hypothetical protein